MWKILIIYFIYVIVKANRKAEIIVKFKIFIYRNIVKKERKINGCCEIVGKN